LSTEKILINKRSLIKFKNEIDFALTNRQNVKSLKISKDSIQQGDLTNREKEILDYIRMSPGTTKQSTVDHFGQEGLGKYSRVTIFKTISDLEKYGLIVVRPNQNNRQMHHLYVNNESILYSLIQDFETFKNAFFVLLEKAKVKYIEYEKGATNPKYHYRAQEKYMASQYDLSKQLLHIYRYFIDVNSIRVLFNWPAQTEDPQISEKVISIFFKRIREIQLKLSEIMKEVITIEDNYKEFADILLRDWHYTVDKFLIELFQIFKWMDMEKEIRDILQCLLKFSKGLLPLEDILLKLRQNGIVLKEFQ
jgi:DNA-binding MarR family transcriptional regulator